MSTIQTTTAQSIDLTCRLTSTGFVWTVKGLEGSSEVPHDTGRTNVGNATAALAAYTDKHCESADHFVLAPADNMNFAFVAMKVSQ